MYRSLLVAIDGTQYSEWSRQVAKHLLTPGGSLVFLHVIDSLLIEGTFLQDLAGALGIEPYLELSPKLEKVLRTKGETLLAAAKAACENEGLRCRIELAEGLVANEIVKRSIETEAVVVGQRGTNAEFHVGLAGSVAEAVVRKSARPVIVVPGPVERLDRALLAFDGSAPAARACSEASRYCGARNLELTVLVCSTSTAAAQPIVEEAKRYLEGAPHPWRIITQEGKPNEQIVTVARDFNLIVMGAHGHNRIVELVLGSTTEYVLRNMPCPTLFVR